MAKYVVKIKDKVTKGKGDPVDVDTLSIDIGSRSECVVHLDDPVAAERHAQIVFDAGIFRIEDLGSAVGTFVNGRAAEEPTALKDGDSIVIGITRFVVTLTEKGGTPGLQLDGEIGGFAYEDGDLDAWVKDEVAFGRYPALRTGNWLMVFSVVLLIPLLFLDSFEEPLLDPGPLSHSHAALFELDLESAPDGRMKELATMAQEQGCAVCHDSLNRTPMDKCLVCHETLMTEQHPFQPTPGGNRALADRTYQEHDCLLCHVDHRGSDVEVRGTFIPELPDVPDTCSECHDDVDFDPSAIQRELKAPPNTRDTEIHYNSFPHDVHLAPKQGEPIACEVCHFVPPEMKSRSSEPERDFGPVKFAKCMECHAEKEAERNPDLRASWGTMSADLFWRVAWHGTENDGASCLQCHTKVYDREMIEREVSRVAVRSWKIQRRDHADLFDKSHPKTAAGRACEDCHLDGAPDVDTAEGEFWHAVHMDTLDPPAGDDTRGALALSASCQACHAEVLDGGALAEKLASPRYEGPAHGDGSGCSKCHSPDLDSTTSYVKGLGEVPWPPTTPRRNFPHGVHMDTNQPTLQRGCFACHEFSDPSDDADFSRLPVTRPEAMDCSLCHAEGEGEQQFWHANVGGGSCTKCHTLGDPVYSGQPRRDKKWPAYTRFDHYSAGHYDATTDGECAKCHTGLDDSTSILDAEIPTEASLSCRECHVSEKTRFHWR